MNAKKCDRCGNFYEGDGGYKKAGDFRLIRNGYFNDDYIDLCPTCSCSLLEWFKHGNDVTKEGTKNEPKRVPQ